MEVIVRRQNQEHCASITCMIRHYVARRAQVIEDHPHNAADRMMSCIQSGAPVQGDGPLGDAGSWPAADSSAFPSGKTGHGGEAWVRSAVWHHAGVVAPATPAGRVVLVHHAGGDAPAFAHH